MKNYKVILIVFLICIGATVFSVFKYLASLKEKYDLLGALNQIKTQVATLENEKQNLLQLQEKLAQENSQLQDSLNESGEKLTRLDSDFAAAQMNIEQLNSQISLLKAENTAIREEKDNLNNQLTQVSQEKEALSARLSSLSELKKAIRELKIQMRSIRREIKQKAGAEKIIEGNRGYVIKDGKTTYPAKIKIEVKPLPLTE